MTYGADLQFSWRAATRVVFGAGKIAKLGPEAAQLGSRVLVVTDPLLAGMPGVVGVAVDSLRAAGLEVEVFGSVESDPSIQNIHLGVAAADQFKPDLFVGIGGGSSMDAAKAIDMLYVCGDDIGDHVGANTVKVELLPVIAVPTTAGTGSEASFAAVVSDHERRLKIPLAEHAFTPRLAILDPELTVGLPAGLTAATGMDAYAHAIDVLHSTRRQPFNDALAHHVLRTVHRHLRQAVSAPDDLTARGQMLAAACSMGFALSTTPYGVIHALGHPLGAHFGVHHGVSVALFCEPAMRWNLAQCEPHIRRSRARRRLASAADPDAAAAAALMEATDALMRDLALPRRLGELEAEVGEAAIPALSRDAARDIGAAFNLRDGKDPLELEDVYRSIL